MKKTMVLFSAAVILSAGPVFAHCGSCGMDDEHGDMIESTKGKMMKEVKKGDWVEKKLNMMADDLGLTEQQQEEIKAIMKDKAERMEEIHVGAGDEMKAIMDDYEAKLKDVLTEEQYEKHAKKVLRMQKEMKHMKMEHTGEMHETHQSGIKGMKGAME
ncbi:MAG: hypothetical protein KC713_03960 [Candidatus Omnitrophica bacterium]|nr:hypothetical protein [Candidatus Omnitrophota bacterium]